MKYIIVAKKLTGMLKLAQKHGLATVVFSYHPAYVGFLNFLIRYGVVYCFVVNANRQVVVYVKNRKKKMPRIAKIFKYRVDRYRYIKKNVYKLSDGVACFSTVRGLISSQELYKHRIGGLHIISV